MGCTGITISVNITPLTSTVIHFLGYPRPKCVWSYPFLVAGQLENNNLLLLPANRAGPLFHIAKAFALVMKVWGSSSSDNPSQGLLFKDSKIWHDKFVLSCGFFCLPIEFRLKPGRVDMNKKLLLFSLSFFILMWVNQTFFQLLKKVNSNAWRRARLFLYIIPNGLPVPNFFKLKYKQFPAN